MGIICAYIKVQCIEDTGGMFSREWFSNGRSL